MKQFLCVLLSLCFLLALFLPAATAKDAIYDIALDSQGVYFFNLETGTVLYEKAAESTMFPASTTKIMTALVVLENCEDPKNTTITVPNTEMFQYIIEDGGVNAQLSKGETFTVYDLLLGLMMNSFCDVADLLAYHFGGGDISVFVEKMNAKAEELKLENTHFANAHGLHNANHYSSPKDIALFFQAALENPLFREIISTRTYTIPATAYHKERPLRYTIDCYYPDDDHYLDAYFGGKSGFTDQAGRCLATYSVKDGVSYISVLLGANMDSNLKYPGNMAQIETATLTAYAYEHYELKTVLQKGDPVSELSIIDSEQKAKVVAGQDFLVLARIDGDAEYRLELPEEISADQVEDGKAVGSAVFTLNEEDMFSCPLVLSYDGEAIQVQSEVEKSTRRFFSAVAELFHSDAAFVTLLVLLIVVIGVCIPAVRITHSLHKKSSRPPKH